METLNLIGLIALFGILYSFSDAWHDEKVINQDKAWHKIDAFIKALVSGAIALVTFLFTKDYILMGIIFLLILLIRAATFNFFLNKLMKWEAKHKRKEGFDLIPGWVWWLCLIGLGVLIFFKYY